MKLLFSIWLCIACTATCEELRRSAVKLSGLSFHRSGWRGHGSLIAAVNAAPPKDPTDRTQTCSYRGPASKALDFAVISGAMIVPLVLIMTAEQWASNEGAASKLAPTLCAAAFLGLGALCTILQDFCTRAFVLGLGSICRASSRRLDLRPRRSRT